MGPSFTISQNSVGTGVRLHKFTKCKTKIEEEM